MEAQAPLVGADGAVHLDAESAIDLDLALIVEPWYAEHDDPLGLDDALENSGGDDIRDALQGRGAAIPGPPATA